MNGEHFLGQAVYNPLPNAFMQPLTTTPLSPTPGCFRRSCWLVRLGIRELAAARLSLGNPAANPNRADKLFTRICSSLVGGDCIDDAGVLRAGDTARNQRETFCGFARIARERDWVSIPDYEGAAAA